MSHEKIVTISARVTPRVRTLAEAVAQLSGTTLSAFVAAAVEEVARRELANDGSRRQATSDSLLETSGDQTHA
jgi:uncharacterized protein (DUF1778 family)